MGIAATRVEERHPMARTESGNAKPIFESHQAIMGAGVLFLLPALLSCGLLKANDIYELPENHYYGLDSIILVLAFMALARIKNPEQLNKCQPGELGRIIGLDRIPEMKCLRNKIKILADQKKAQEFNRLLIEEWYKDDPDSDGSYLYIDGHQRIYYGGLANLPVKYISRQKLCLAATTEYWVNDASGQPTLVVTGELTEKLEDAIEDLIIPELKKTCLLPTITDKTQEVPSPKETLPECTLIFDREGYHPAFFKKLWENERIAIITYRKNTHDLWNDNLFKETKVVTLEKEKTMYIHEQSVTLDGVEFREIRRRKESGQQTSIITTNYHISSADIAGKMFGRWNQENFFKYLISDYDFDKMVTYGVEEVDGTKEVINPMWRKAENKLKNQKEKTRRLKAQMYSVYDKIMDADLGRMPKMLDQMLDLQEKIEASESEDEKMKSTRDEQEKRITVEGMGNKYQKLKTESKLMMNIIKMICYRAETAVANLIASFLPDSKIAEKRSLVKQIIQTNADLLVDEQGKTITVQLHSLSANRYNEVAEKLAHLLNETETVFPGSDLRLIFKSAGK